MMLNVTNIMRFLLVGMLVFGSGMMAGCSKGPSKEDVSKLEDARVSAESAERKLAELRQERLKLEQELQAKKTELQKKEQEEKDLQNKVQK